MMAEKKRRRAPQRVGAVVSEVLESIGIRERVERAGTAAAWAESVGPHIARVTKAARVRGGTLFVEVASAAWMTELNMMRRTLLQQLNEGRTEGRIDRIVFVQSGGERGKTTDGRG